ncbi:hypothetical protein F2P56_022700, partial [Juglans regia]
MVFRLAPILDRIISLEQAAFIPGRSIFENISLTQELVRGGRSLHAYRTEFASAARINSGTCSANGKMKEFRSTSPHERSIMENLSCPINPVASKKLKMITWRPPVRGRVRLNVDGGSCGNLGESGGGGVIQNSQGEVVVGFAHSYGHATNTLAECRALLDGLRLCKHLGLRDIMVESDST